MQMALISDMYSLRTHAPQFYEELFNQQDYWNIFPDLVAKRVLTAEASDWLIRKVEYKEIKAGLFGMRPDKAPGPNRFNGNFFQKNWNLVKGDVTAAIYSFFKSGKLLKKLNHTFLTLVPKKVGANSLSDYRPIS